MKYQDYFMETEEELFQEETEDEEEKPYLTKEYIRRGIHAQEKGKSKSHVQVTILVVLFILIIALLMAMAIMKELDARDMLDMHLPNMNLNTITKGVF